MTLTLIRNGTLIDGKGAAPVPGAAVLIENNRIQAAGPAASVPQPPEAVVVDARGGFILPGLIDCHVHLMMQGVNIARDMAAPFSIRFYNSVVHMRRTVQAGVTTVRDAGGADLGTRMAAENGLVLGPRMHLSIAPLTVTGGQGDGWMRSGREFGLFSPYPGVPDGRADGVDAVRHKVREVLRAGADVVKIFTTGGVLSPTSHPSYTQFSPEELDVIVKEAAWHGGKRVMSHAQGTGGIKSAVRAGVQSIEHAVWLDDEAIDLMLKNGTYLVPTLLAPFSIIETGEREGMPEYAMQKNRETVAAHRDSICRAHRAGVKIAMGTDAGVMPHGTNLRELGLMVEIGMTPMEAIVATTRVAAECLGWQDRIGTLEAGKFADVVIAATDPLQNIRSLEQPENITHVLLDGKFVKGTAAC